jgi:hypothetical protein
MTGQGTLFGICRRKLRDIKQKDLEAEAPWLAALLDGEGTYTIIQDPRSELSFSASIELGMTDEATIKKVKKLFGVSSRLVKSKDENHKDCYVIKVSTQKENMQICQALKKYSVTKKKRIGYVIKFLQLKIKLRSLVGDKKKQCLSEIVDVFIDWTVLRLTIEENVNALIMKQKECG